MTSKPRRVRQYTRFLAGGIIIALVILVLLLTSLRSSSVYYLTVTELNSQGSSIYGQRVRVAGLVDRETVDWEMGRTTLRFDLVQGDEALPVQYQGVVPDAFAQSEALVVEGEYSPDGIFLADTLVVQCPSKYEAQVTE